MRTKCVLIRWSAMWIALCLLAGLATPARAAAPTVLFSTGFEASEGYNASQDLAGQNGWVQFGGSSEGWNGLIDQLFTGQGQQAYVGYTAPAGNPEFLTVWRPNLPAPPTNQPILKFSVQMAIMDSSTQNGRYDDFRWSVYTPDGHRLFSLDFDNQNLVVSYALDDGAGFLGTGRTFQPNTIYQLVITLDLARNRWGARLDTDPLVTEQPITTQPGVTVAVGDFDAVWAIRTPGSPGDNYLAFDNYTVTAHSLNQPPTLQTLARQPDGSALVRLTGEPGRTYVVETTANLKDWAPIKTNTPPDGVFEFLDSGAIHQTARFYRGLVRD